MMRSMAALIALTLFACSRSPSTSHEERVAPTAETKPSKPLMATEEMASAKESAERLESHPSPSAAPTPQIATKTTPKAPLSFQDAMVALASCERDDTGLLLSEPERCLAPVRHAKSAALAGDTTTQEQRIKRLSETLTELLEHDEPTAVFYALQEGLTDFRGTRATTKALEGLMTSPIETISEAAAKARFALKGASEAHTLALALTRFASDPQRRVRHAACQHLGSARYRGKREVFQALFDVAEDQDEEMLIRSCAARELGDVATNRDLRTLTALLHSPDIQQATIVALQRGVGTKKAIDAYVRWFERHATQPEKVHWTSMHAFLPFDTELEQMPQPRTKKTLTRIAGHDGHDLKVRVLAIEGLKRLNAMDALATLRTRTPADAAPELMRALRP